MCLPGLLPAEIKEESEQRKVKRILLMVAYNILLVPYYWCKLCYYASHVEKYTEEERYKLLRFIDNRAITGGRIHIEVPWGRKYTEKERVYVFPLIIRDFLTCSRSYRPAQLLFQLS